MALTLEDGPSRVARLMSTPRMLLANDPTIRHFANSVASIETVPAMRFAHVDLDYIYDPDPAQTDRNLGELVQRIVDMQINTVFLQAYADPQADGLVRSVYFPNRWLPMRADLFNRVAWQLHNRADVFVYAWMPVLALDLDPSIARVVRWDPQRPEAAPAPDPDLYRRLSPFDPVARQRIGDLYEDLARHAFFDGILFHDDAMLGDFEDAGPAALAAYQKAGLPGSIAALRADPETMQRWTRYKSRHLVDFTAELAERAPAPCAARASRPPATCMRSRCSTPPAKPGSRKTGRLPGRLRLDRAHGHALHGKVPAGQELAWLDRIVDAVARRRPDALDRTVFELQAVDWRTGPGRPEPTPVDTATLAGWMQRLQLRARAASAITPTISRKTSPGCKASGPPSPKRGSPSDDRPSSRPAHPVRGAERALRLRPGADQPGAAGIRVLLPAVHVRPVDGRRPVLLVALGRHWAWGARREAPALAGNPLVSILVPCYNEADNGEDTLLAALNQNYPHIEVIAINDGSSDGTAQMLDRLAAQHERLRVVHLAQNQGKAMALRMGALAARSEYLVCIDGDAMLDPDAAAYLVAPLIDNPRVGAVTGNPRIRTRSTLIGRIQVGEFSSIIGLIKRTQRVYGQVFTVSGVVAAFRRTALDRVSYWSLDMITEDIDISWKLQRDHWSIFYEPRGLCWILMPETLRGLWKQRLRWAQGGAEVFLKNLRSIWNWRHRRLWPLMAEFCLSTAWSFAFAISVLLWLVSQVVALPNNMHIASLLPPAFTGMMLAVVCLLQFAVSILIDRRYEPGLARSLYWVIWYPLAYWMVSLLTTLVKLSQGHAAQAGPPRAGPVPIAASNPRRHHDHHHAPVPRRLPVRPAAHGRRLVRLRLSVRRRHPRHPARGRRRETSLWAVFLPTANTLWGYAALALANGAALVAWALYNHRRFAGKDHRRRAAVPRRPAGAQLHRRARAVAAAAPRPRRRHPSWRRRRDHRHRTARAQLRGVA